MKGLLHVWINFSCDIVLHRDVALHRDIQIGGVCVCVCVHARTCTCMHVYWFYIWFQLSFYCSNENLYGLFCLMQHLPAGYPRDFPLPSAHTDMLDIYVEYRGNETTVRMRVEPFTVHLPTLVSMQL